MGKRKIEYLKTTLTCDFVLSLLQISDNEFIPSLSKTFDLKQYAQKLSEFAQFILAIENGQIAGFVAYYLNDEGNFIYVPLIWVSSLYHRQGIGMLLISQLSQLSLLGYKSIRLEVLKNNAAAASFYQHEKFEKIEDRNDKYLMEKLLN